ncbi:MAG: hypothetical protein ACHQD9_06700 [Chitinophagales bacterium]
MKIFNLSHLCAKMTSGVNYRIFKSSNLQIIFVLLTVHYSLLTTAQTPNQIINTVNQRFAKINDYKADARVVCDVPSLKVNPINVKVIYKKPDKFKVKAAGILVLPKQNANFLFTTLRDTTSYTAVKTGEEIINGVKTQIINVIPLRDTTDLILGKFWIDDSKRLVMKSQLTTKSQGTILIENTYGAMSQYGLPDKMLFTIETQKFKLPKALALDIGTSSAGKETDAGDGKGRITLSFSNYVVNKGVTAKDFEE